MRYILDTYIRAEDTRVISELGNMSIVELLLQGKTTTPVDLVRNLPGNDEAKAEIIDNNLQHEIVKKIVVTLLVSKLLKSKDIKEVQS